MSRMRAAIPSLIAVLCLTPIGAGAADTPAGTTQVCFTEAAVAPLVAQMPVLALTTEQLIRHAIDGGAAPKDVYLLSRQMMLSERIHRRLVEPTTDCERALGSVQRDYAILARVYTAYDAGDAELGVAKLTADPARAALGEVRGVLDDLDPRIAALGPSTAAR